MSHWRVEPYQNLAVCRKRPIADDVRSYNFSFMRIYNPQFDRLGALAERYFQDDPNGSLTKLRQFGELLAQEVAARIGLYTSTDQSIRVTAGFGVYDKEMPNWRSNSGSQ